MSKEHSEWLASLPPAEREALNKGLSALETMADLWAVEINLGKMSETIAGEPDPAKRAFAIKSMVEQGYIEGAYCTYLDYKNGKLPGQSARPEALRKPDYYLDTAEYNIYHTLEAAKLRGCIDSDLIPLCVCAPAVIAPLHGLTPEHEELFKIYWKDQPRTNFYSHSPSQIYDGLLNVYKAGQASVRSPLARSQEEK